MYFETVLCLFREDTNLLKSASGREKGPFDGTKCISYLSVLSPVGFTFIWRIYL
jgi:hypothetical protein